MVRGLVKVNSETGSELTKIHLVNSPSFNIWLDDEVRRVRIVKFWPKGEGGGGQTVFYQYIAIVYGGT